MYKYFFVIVLALNVACSNSSEPEEINEETNIVSSKGNEVNLDGRWESERVDLGGTILAEVFEFNSNNLIITIDEFADLNPQSQPINTETITISFEPKGTINCVLNGSSVVGNKVSGTSHSSSTNETQNFKQSFFIRENGTLEFYHGVFADDGGRISSEGYPLDLHNIKFVKK